jgi:carboxypeptidase PM20D1
LGHLQVTVQPARGEILADSGWEASSPSSLSSTAFGRLAGLIQAHFPGCIIAPFLMAGATDSRYFRPLCDSVYGFAPFRSGMSELNRAHGANERLSVADCGKMVAFYIDAIKALGQT